MHAPDRRHFPWSPTCPWRADPPHSRCAPCFVGDTIGRPRVMETNGAGSLQLQVWAISWADAAESTGHPMGDPFRFRACCSAVHHSPTHDTRRRPDGQRIAPAGALPSFPWHIPLSPSPTPRAVPRRAAAMGRRTRTTNQQGLPISPSLDDRHRGDRDVIGGRAFPNGIHIRDSRRMVRRTRRYPRRPDTVRDGSNHRASGLSGPRDVLRDDASRRLECHPRSVGRRALTPERHSMVMPGERPVTSPLPYERDVCLAVILAGMSYGTLPASRQR